jgi:hypothetical protein
MLWKAVEDFRTKICLKMKYFLFFCRLKSFCGSIADGVQSKSNIVHIHYFAEAAAINSSFIILYTAYREKGTKREFFSRSIVDLWEIWNLISFTFLSSMTRFPFIIRQLKRNVWVTSTIVRIKLVLRTL